jgi:glycosyl transferase family 25
MIPVVVISLSDCTDRRNTIRLHLDALSIPFKFFDAVDARQFSADQMERHAPQKLLNYYRPLSPGEVGCSLSHIAVLNSIAAGIDEFVCVLEDDAKPSRQITSFLDSAALKKLPQFDVLRLATLPRSKRRLLSHHTDVGGISVLTIFRPHALSTAQIYSIAGARKIAADMKCVQAPFDDALYRENHVAGLRILEVRPSVVHPSEEAESTIGLRRPALDQSIAGWLTKEWWKRRREWRALVNYVRAWGFAGILKLRMGFPP